MDDQKIRGIHHVTAIASDPRQNIWFYTSVLGLRLVKVTINYDDPGSYHFYYGDAIGSPGTIMTFFAWPAGRPGKVGSGQVAVTSLSVPPGSLPYWQARLEAEKLAVSPGSTPFGEQGLAFADPDGLPLKLIEDPGAEPQAAWTGGSVAADEAIRGFHSVELAVQAVPQTVELMTGTLGFTLEGEAKGVTRLTSDATVPGHSIDIAVSPVRGAALAGVGSVHHVAFRTPGDEEQLAWKQRLEDLELGVSPVMDRQYFQSIYFLEPGGVLLEIATDPPGFTTDESAETLGTALRLPEWLEAGRSRIQAALPPIPYPAALEGAI